MTEAPAATERMVKAAAEEAWAGERPRPERLLVLRARPRWDGPSEVRTDQIAFRVVAAPSTLAVRAALAETLEAGRLVVLTDIDDEELGVGVLAHAVRQRSSAMDVWDAVRQVFRVRGRDVLDSNLVRDGETFARSVVDSAPSAGWPPPAGGVLTRDHAYRSLLSGLVGLEPQRLDVAGLLDWSRAAQGTLALRDLEPGVRGPLVKWLKDRLGPVAGPVLDLCLVGLGTDAVALGLVAEHLYGSAGTERAQGAFEQKLFGRHLDRQQVRPWSEAAVGWVERALQSRPVVARAVFDRAEEVLVEVAGEAAAAASSMLPAGLVSRQAALGAALSAALPKLSQARVEAVEAAWSRRETHRLAESEQDALDPALMAVRLLRWLRRSQPELETMHEALVWQVETGGWVDRARQFIWNGASEPALAASLGTLFEASTVQRVRGDRQAARLLAGAVARQQEVGRVVPVEEALERVVLPLTESSPVLLLVLDGMSAAVACELAEHVIEAGWDEVVQDGARKVLLAGLPSVTSVSRTSLLTGRLQTGGQAEERRGLPLIAGRDALLFHLGDLAGVAGSSLPVDVREAVLDAGRPLVAAVLNAVDDSLSGGDPARTRWTVDEVRHLRPLLERAAVAGRTVVLVSDHGHVVDRPDVSRLRTAQGGGARWRPVDGDVEEDEVLLAGPRVALGGGQVVAAVDETLRFRARKEGYHGGAALAELAIPVLTMKRRGSAPPPGWTVADELAPVWWREAPAPVVQDQGTETLF